jgi:hypothetical protein
MERDSRLVSKIKSGKDFKEKLTGKLNNLDAFKLEFIKGSKEDIEIFLAKLDVYTKVLKDINFLNLTGKYGQAAEKIRKEKVIPQLEPLETPHKSKISDLKLKQEKRIEDLIEQLKHELWEPIKKYTIQLLRERHPFLFIDQKVVKITDNLINNNLKEEFKLRNKSIENFNSRDKSFDYKELREETEYLIKENMKYWIEHWAFEEIDQELKK